MNELRWRDLWQMIRKQALDFQREVGRIPVAKLEETLQKIETLYGEEWLARVVNEGHPIINGLNYWPGTEEIDSFVDLLSYAEQVSGSPQVLHELVNKTMTCGSAEFRSVVQELSVLRALNLVGLPTRKLLERELKAKGQPKKSQDLATTFCGSEVSIEVTRLLSLNSVARANSAFRELSTTHLSLWGGRGTLELQFRPYSKRHVRELVLRMQKTIHDVRIHGVARLIIPNILHYIIWDEDREHEVLALHQEHSLKLGDVGMPILAPSTISPFRIVEKLHDKQRQAPEGAWILIVQVFEGLFSKEQALVMVRECAEFIYDYPNLIGIMLYQTTGVGLFSGIFNLNTPDIAVETTRTSEHTYQQTIILKNQFTDFRWRRQFYELFLRAGRETGWNPRFSP